MMRGGEMRTRIRQLVLRIGSWGVVALIGLAAAAPAAALRCDRTDNDHAEASRVIQAMTRRLDVMEARIVEALTLQTGQLSGYQAQSTRAVIEAIDSQTRLRAPDCA